MEIDRNRLNRKIQEYESEKNYLVMNNETLK